MKKVIKPAEREEAIYFTDFKGQMCGEFGSPVDLKIEFGYGSEYDGDTLTLNLNDEEIKLVLDVIKQNMSLDYKKQLREKRKQIEESYDDSMQSRDWSSCEFAINSLHLLKYMLDSK